MCSQSPILTHSKTKALGSGSLTISHNNNHNNSNKEHKRSTKTINTFSSSGPSTPSNQKIKLIQMTTGGGINISNTNSIQDSTTVQQNPPCNTILSTSSVNTLGKSSTISSTLRHNNASLSSNNVNNNNNSTTAINNNNNNNTLSTNNNEGNNNPNSTKLQTLEQRKLELEQLLNEKNWLLQQIHKQEAQILNGSYENFHLFEIGKLSGTILSTGGGGGSTFTTNSILRRKGSSSLKLPKSNVNFIGKNNRYTLSKSEYDLAHESKHNNNQLSSSSSANPNIISIKKRQGPPQKTNSFHDSTSTSALSLTKSPSFEYNGSGSGQQSGGNSIKYGVVRPPHNNSNENLSNILGITQCDKYYLSPTNQMYTDGNGFIKASQNIKQCLSSPSPMHTIMSLNDTHQKKLTQQQQVHMTNGHHCLVHHNNGSQPDLEQYDALSLSPSNAFDQNHHSNLWRALSNNDRSAWCDNSYIDLDSESVSVNQFHSLKPLAKQILPPPGTSLQHSPECPSLGNFYSVGGGLVVGSYPNTLEKSFDELSISSVNSETSKKPKNKQWMESSLDGPIIRSHILQSTPSVTDAIALCPPLSPKLSQNPLQYAYYNVAARQSATAAINSAIPNGKLTPTPAAAGAGGSGMLLVPVVNSRSPTRTLTHDSHPPQQHQHKQNYRERTKLSSQSMSSGSYRTPKTKLDEGNSHLSHSTSYLNVDPYHHHHFQQQPQLYHHNHFHLEMPNGPFPQQKQIQQQNSPKASPSSTLQQQSQSKLSPTIQLPPSALVNDNFIGNIRYATSVATQPSRLCNSSQTLTKNTKTVPPNSLSISTVQQLSPVGAATSPDIRIESPKNMTVVQQATFLPYKEVTKPFEMSDFYKYSTKFRQKEANTTMSKNPTQN